MIADSPKRTDIPDADFCLSQVTENPSVLGGKKDLTLLELSSSGNLTNGELTNVLASHRQWGGYRVTKAIAWVICLVPGSWLARCQDMACGPSSLAEAKAAAMAMANGAIGDYRIANALTHLNGLTARLSERFGDAA
jgi:hypothetical protein